VGLNVSADLAVDLKLNVGLTLPLLGALKLATVEVATVPAATANLVALKLATAPPPPGCCCPAGSHPH